MFRLIIDAGNSQTKVGVFEGSVLVHKESYKKFSQENFDAILKAFKIDSLISASVAEFQLSDLEIPIDIKKIEFNSELKLPIVNLYGSKETLGVDRLAGVLGMYYRNKNKNNLLIDAGTCITFDFLNSKNEYLGGSIHPGIKMRLKALNNFTNKLPLVDIPEGLPERIGNNTENAILSGVIHGVLMEVQGFINWYKKDFGELDVFLTGGDSGYLNKRIINTTFVEEDFVLIGLNNLLENLMYEKK